MSSIIIMNSFNSFIQEDYEKGGRQKIGQMLKNFGGYNETLPTSEEMETSSKKVRYD